MPLSLVRVLVVDDDALNRRALARVLRANAARVVEASTLIEAQAQLAAVDAVVTDIDLGDEDGLVLLDVARVPVVVVSGSADRFAEAYRRGAVDCFRKPLPLADIVATLAELRAGAGRCAGRTG